MARSPLPTGSSTPTRVTRTSSGFRLHPRRRRRRRYHLAKVAASDGDGLDWTGGAAAGRSAADDEDGDTVGDEGA